MSKLNWFFPETLTEAEKLLHDGCRPHGGGTFLIKTSLSAGRYFVVSKISELNESSTAGSKMLLGAGINYSEAADTLNESLPGNFISKALSSAAATPLRNRITLGGSIYAAPIWSDFIGPLHAADAAVLTTASENEISIAEFYKNKNLKNSGIIQKVIIPADNISGEYFRFTLTGFDYPIFTISCSERKNGSLTCCLTGAPGGVICMAGSIRELEEQIPKLPVFNKSRGMSGEYLKKRAEIELKRILNSRGTAA